MNAPPIRVLMMCSEFPPGPGGIGNQAYHLANFFIAHGFQVTIHTASRKEFDEGSFDSESLMKIVRYSSGKNLPYKIFTSIAFFFSRRTEVDCVILSGLNQLLLALPIRLFSKSKVIAVIHGHEVRMVKKPLKHLLLLALKSASHIVAVSNFSKDILMSTGLRRSITVIPNGVQRANRKNGPEKKDFLSLALVTVGSITRRKGQHNVVKALPALAKFYPSLTYHIIGMPNERSNIESLANELNVLQHVKIHGVVSDEEKEQLVTSADIFVMLSENTANGDVEGFGIAILEANAFGVPAIGARNTGIEQAIDEGVSGLLINGSDPNQLVAAVYKIRSNYAAYCQGALEWSQKHDWQKIGDRYLELISFRQRVN
jgi:phosphatidyl-myo-inositol dimannoside synthase